MPRVARRKTETSIYHIMVRSISEIELFKDRNDKIKYFSLIKRYQLKYSFKVYSYCLLDNHGHLLVDCNGADISRIMHGINLSYAMYFNKKYCRHGHVFQDRFKSKIIDSDKYLSTVCAYIHANSKDVLQNKKRVLKYEFSSLREYVKGTNVYGILNKDFLRTVLNLASKKGMNSHLFKISKDNLERELDGEFENEGYEYRGHRHIIARRKDPSEIIEFIARYLGLKEKHVHVKYNSKYIHIRALSCFFMSCFCNITQKKICKVLGNISQSRISELSSLGLKLSFGNSEYDGIVDSFLIAS